MRVLTIHPCLNVVIFSILVLTVSTLLGNLVGTTLASSENCIYYDSSLRLISVSCRSSNLESLLNFINDPSVLKKESDGIWLLNANLQIDGDSTFFINSTDTNWLKINSADADNAYRIQVLGSLKIDSVKLSSWNTTSNSYAVTDGDTPRASITVLPTATGKTDITNSEIAYLGDGNVSRGQGLSYWAGDNSIIKNNTIHHMWYGFYSERIGNVTIEDNHVYDDMKYGIDPHTGTHDMVIRNNKVHDNGHIGIICSLDCKNITIDGNVVFNNTDAGIMLSKNVQNSIVRNNKVQDENTGVSVSDSGRNEIYLNDISDNNNGIQIKSNSSHNQIYSNYIKNSAKCGIEISHSALNNTMSSNKVLQSKSGICLFYNPSQNMMRNNTIDAASGTAIYAKDSNAEDNVFQYNQLVNVSRNPVRLINGTLKIINNTVN